MYKKGLSAYKIMDILKISSKNKVYKILKAAKLTRPYGEDKRPNVISNYFSEINTSEKAYWLGFFYADGCVRSNSYGMSIGIHPKDIELLERLKKVLNLSNKIQLTKQPLVVLQFSNKQIHGDLIKHGCVPKKSLIIKPPINVPEDLIFDFIRGNFDGDGSLSFRKKEDRFDFNLLGTLSLVTWFKEKLKLTTKISKYKNIYRVATSNSTEINRIKELIYTNNCFCLKRKKEIFKKFSAVHKRKLMENNRANTKKVKRIEKEKIHGKICKRCNKIKPIEEYVKFSSGQTYDGLQIYCKECMRIFNKNFYSQHRAKQLNNER